MNIGQAPIDPITSKKLTAHGPNQEVKDRRVQVINLGRL